MTDNEISLEIEHPDVEGRPVVMFLCTHNAGRSQMALGFFRHHAGDSAIGWSAGSEPGNELNPAAIAAMPEHGLDVASVRPIRDQIEQRVLNLLSELDVPETAAR